MKSKLLYCFSLGIFFASLSLHAQECSKMDEKSPVNNSSDKKQEEEPPKTGNFSLPTSQQPAALFGFGGNVIDEGEVQLFFFADDFNGKKKVAIDLMPNILFGITDNCSILFDFPFTTYLEDDGYHSSGVEDFFIQIEYAFYNKKNSTYIDQATILGNITFPTGSVKRTPPTGFGSPSLFLGATYYRTMVDWFLFTCQGGILTTTDHKTKIGDQFLYQFGVGRNIPSPEGWIYAWMIEIDGQYNKKNRINGHIDHNSGGNTIYLTPSLWISSKQMLLQFGFSAPINQHLYGRQNKFDYAVNLNVAWSFY